jgi:anti-sigma regulatory factor (Ser/Thr protein kinase)
VLETRTHPTTECSTRLSLPSDPSAAAAARAAVVELGHDLPTALTERLSLIASELVTNALRHAVGPDPAPVLTIEVTPDRATLVVEDRGTSFNMDALTASSGRIGGWGLRLVDSLVDRWHLELDHGTRVVCELDRRELNGHRREPGRRRLNGR